MLTIRVISLNHPLWSRLSESCRSHSFALTFSLTILSYSSTFRSLNWATFTTRRLVSRRSWSFLLDYVCSNSVTDLMVKSCSSPFAGQVMKALMLLGRRRGLWSNEMVRSLIQNCISRSYSSIISLSFVRIQIILVLLHSSELYYYFNYICICI